MPKNTKALGSELNDQLGRWRLFPLVDLAIYMTTELRKRFRQLRCRHTHTFKHDLPPDTHWYSNGKKMGHHSGLQVCGCYICGKVWCRDWQA